MVIDVGINVGRSERDKGEKGLYGESSTTKPPKSCS
jgi:hypothetical protein